MKPRKIKNLPESTSGYPDTSVHDIKPESNPFTSVDIRMLAYAWAGMGVRLLLIAGGVFSVWQYMQQREEKRIERSLEMVQLWEQEAYQTAQRAVNERIDALNEQHSNLLGSNPNAAEIAIYRGRIGIASMTEQGGSMPVSEFHDEFGRVLYFLNRIAFCVEGNLCSEEVADAYFFDYAASFWSYYSSYVEEERKKGRPKFGIAVENYVNKN
ncbi:MAG: hypothetical protein AB3N20_06015 [Rhizobiaceae bacterium]